MDVDENYLEDMKKMWEQALVKLRELCERPYPVITVNTSIFKPIEHVWDYFVKPEHIEKWNFADNSWECPKAQNALRVGGRFSSTMAAKDGSASFDFTGTYTKVEPHSLIEYVIDDGRTVSIRFSSTNQGVEIVEEFEAESSNSQDLQKSVWQAIMDNFKKYYEGQN